MAVQCPICGKPDIKTLHGLRKHLSGGKASGGHDIAPDVAGLQSTAIWQGTPSVATAPSVPTAEVLAAIEKLSDSAAADYLRVLLAGLVADKQLPKYQFERRIDALLAPFLPKIVQKAFGGGAASAVVPEFPLKKPGASNQSTNADHLLILRDRPARAADCWVLLELKTDSSSYDLKQAEIYRLAQLGGWSRLRDDIVTIRNASTKKDGYTALLQRLDDGAGREPPEHVEILFLTPSSIPPPGFHSIHFSELLNVDMDVHPEVWELLRTLVFPVLS
jgi:hypothetical protein